MQHINELSVKPSNPLEGVISEGNELLKVFEHCYTHVKQKINNMQQIASQQNKAQNSEQVVQIYKRKSMLVQLAQSYKEQIFEIRAPTQTQQTFTNELKEEREQADAAVAASDDDDTDTDSIDADAGIEVDIVETAPTVDAIEATPIVELTTKRSAKKSKSLFVLNSLLYNLKLNL